MTTLEKKKKYLGKYVTVFMTNGFQLKGTLTEVHDDGGLTLIVSNEYEDTVESPVISTIRRRITEQ